MSSQRSIVQLVRTATRNPCSLNLSPASISPFAVRRVLSKQQSINDTTYTHRSLSHTPVRTLQESRPPPPPDTTKTSSTTSSPDPNVGAPRESIPSAPTDPPQEPRTYNFADIQSLISSSSPSSRILIDVREPAELAATGYIPTAVNVPITSSPDALFLPATEFEDRFGFPRPGGETEVVFYCKSGVRSRAAARMAVEARFGGEGKVGEFPGSWKEWSEKGGRVERG